MKIFETPIIRKGYSSYRMRKQHADSLLIDRARLYYGTQIGGRVYARKVSVILPINKILINSRLLALTVSQIILTDVEVQFLKNKKVNCFLTID